MSSEVRYSIRTPPTWVVVQLPPRPDLPEAIPYLPSREEMAKDTRPYGLRKSWPWKAIEGARIPNDPVEDPDGERES